MEKILAVKWRGLGDTVLWSSALQSLRNYLPNSQIDLAYPEPYRTLYVNDARFRKKYFLERKFLKNLPNILKMRKVKYDAIISFHSNSRSLGLAALIGAKEKILHHHSRIPKNFFSDRKILHLGQAGTAIERDLNILRTLGWGGPIEKTRIFPGEDMMRTAREFHSQFSLSGRPIVMISLETTRRSKQWGIERLLTLSRLILEKTGLQILFVYQNDETFNSRYIRNSLSKFGILAKTETINSLIAHLLNASCFIGADSGLMHLAVALSVPTVSLFGPESKAEWHPYQSQFHTAIQKNVRCRSNHPTPIDFAWCGATNCPLSSHACTQTISPEEVVSKLVETFALRI